MAENFHANYGTVRTEGKGDWETPPGVFAKLNKEYHFNIDACASKTNAKCPVFFTEEQDGLQHPWFVMENGQRVKGRVFCNPPHGRSDTPTWCEKVLDELAKGNAELVVMLVADNTSSAWFHKYIRAHATEIHFVQHRIAFWENGAKRSRSPGFGTIVAVFRGLNARVDYFKDFDDSEVESD